MPRKKKAAAGEVILGHELSLDEWLSLFGTKSWDRVFPHNCFATDKHKKAYLSRIQQLDEIAVKNLARSFLNKSANYGVSKDRFFWVLKKYGRDALLNGTFQSEFDRRSLPKNGPQWEGITWVLDLLPRAPLEAIASVRAYMHAHIQYFTDQMIYGHEDVIDMVEARYNVPDRCSCFIGYGRPDEPFAQKLYESLTKEGVHAFFFPTHATPGKRLHKVMREGVNQYDRIILVCSKASLDRPGVLNELTETLQREAREGGKDYLIPIRLDDYVFTDWAPNDAQLAQAVRDRVVADFSGATSDEETYNAAFQKLTHTLDRSIAGSGW